LIEYLVLCIAQINTAETVIAIRTILTEPDITRVDTFTRKESLVTLLTRNTLVAQLAFVTIKTIHTIPAIHNKVGIGRIFVVITYEYQIAIFIEGGAVGVLTVGVLEDESVYPRRCNLKLTELFEKWA